MRKVFTVFICGCIVLPIIAREFAHIPYAHAVVIYLATVAIIACAIRERDRSAQ
jgi:hypothetical protein